MEAYLEYDEGGIASNIINDSTVTGATVADALDTLQVEIDDLSIEAISSTPSYDSDNRLTGAIVGSKTYTNTFNTKGLISSTTDGVNTWNFTYNDDREITAITKV